MNSCDKFCYSKLVVDFAAAGRQRGLRKVYLKHNLLHRNKLGRDVEHHRTHIVLFKTPRGLQQITTLSAQLRHRSELNEGYRDATPISYGPLLIDVSPWNDNRLRYCTTIGSTPSTFYNAERLKHSRSLVDEHKKSRYSTNVPIIFPQVQKSFPSILSERS